MRVRVRARNTHMCLGQVALRTEKGLVAALGRHARPTLADLNRAGRRHRCRILVETQAALVPTQAAEGEQAAIAVLHQPDADLLKQVIPRALVGSGKPARHASAVRRRGWGSGAAL